MTDLPGGASASGARLVVGASRGMTYGASRKIIIYMPFCDDVSSDPNVWVLRVE